MLPSHLRDFSDTTTARSWIYENALDSVKKRFPMEDDEYLLELSDPHYEGKQDFSLSDQKKALLNARRLYTPIKGTWSLTHKPSGVKLDSRSDVIMQVPYLTDRGTFIYKGTEYSGTSQQRLKPGVYTRRANSGDLEAFYNISPGTGKNFRIAMEPETGVFKMHIGQAAIPLYPLLKTLGVDDKQMIQAWGPELVEANIKARSTDAIKKYHAKLVGKYGKGISQEQDIIDALNGYKIDPSVVARTLGIEGDNVSKDMLLRSTQKLLNIAKHEEEVDDRDSPVFSNVLSYEDFIKERIDKDAGKLARSLFQRAKRDKTLKRVPFAALNPYVDEYITGSRLMMPLEETNPMHNLEQMQRIVRTGEGGIASTEAITESARDVNLGQLGFIDPIAGPECFSADTQVFTKRGWIPWPEVQNDALFACNINGKLEFHKASRLIAEHYTGDMYGVDTFLINYLVTANHRCWVRDYSKSFKSYFELAPDVYNTLRTFIATHGAYESDNPPIISDELVSMFEAKLKAHKLPPDPNERVDEERLWVIPFIDEPMEDHVLDLSLSVRQRLFNAVMVKDEAAGGNRYVCDTHSPWFAQDVERLVISMGYSPLRYTNAQGRYIVAVYDQLVLSIPKQHGHSKSRYDGMVYCATVPGGLLFVKRGKGIGHWSGNSSAIGTDTRAAYKTFKGRDQQMYGEFKDVRTGKLEYLRPEDMADKVLAFPGEDMSKPDNMVNVSKRGKITQLPASEVDYQVPSTAHMFSHGANLMGMTTGMMPGRVFYGSKYWSQFLPLTKGEVPLVATQMPDSDSTFLEYYGRKVGGINSPVDGVVKRVTDDKVVVVDSEGNEHVKDLVKDLPFNRTTGSSYFPKVQVGDKVKAGDLLAYSNFIDKDTGSLAMGVNLRAAVTTGSGASFEDAITISESAAQKLSNERLFGYDLEARGDIEINKNKYMSLFSGKFDKAQLDKVDDNGVVKQGTIVNTGDPLILGIGPKLLTPEQLKLGQLHKTLRSAHTNKAVTWDHDYPGLVADIGKSGNTVMVNVKARAPVKVGDKLTTSHALKGVVGRIMKDEDMPRDSVTNEPYDMLLNPMGILSRISPNQLAVMQLAKVAKKLGKQLRIPQDPPKEGWAVWTMDQLNKHGISETTDIFDPSSGKTIKGIADGIAYVHPFHHLAEKKLSDRGAGIGGYTADQQPAAGGHMGGGSKKFGSLDCSAALSHGSFEVIKDVINIRGSKNEDFWKALKLGQPLPEPKVPFVYGKMLNLLKAGGINIRDKGGTLQLLPMTDADVSQLAKGSIKSSKMVDRNFNAIPGGLFDMGATGGLAGNQWSRIDLKDPVPNPVFEEPIRRLLGLRQVDLENIISGTQDIDGMPGVTGGVGLKTALKNLDIDKEIEKHKGLVARLRGSNRDNSIKILGYLSSLKKQGIHPSDLVVSKVPVLPPVFRPISQLGQVTLMADINELYRDVLETQDQITSLTRELGSQGAATERLNLYDAVKAAYGLGSPITPEGRAKNLKGAIRQVIGDRPKESLFQSKVISKPVEGVGRGAATPDPNLDMDSMGIPEDSAWTLFTPFIMRNLVRRGYPAEKVMELIKNREPTAETALQEEMKVRPVIADRAPVWHKFNLMAFKPHIVKDKVVRVSPLVVSGFNLDFDGNCVDFDSKINLRLSKSTFDKLKDGYYDTTLNKGGIMSIINGSKVKGGTIVDEETIYSSIKIGEFPKIGEPVKDKNGADVYKVPRGIQVQTYNHKTGRVKYSDITHFTEEYNCKCVEVKTKSKSVIVSNNASLACFSPASGELVKTEPAGALNMFVPVSTKDTTPFGNFGNRDLGWWIGAFVSDGWLSGGRTIGYAKIEDSLRDEFVRIARSELSDNFLVHTYPGVKGGHKLGNSKKIHCNGIDLANKVRELGLLDGEQLKDKNVRQALAKIIPEELITQGSEEFLLGVLSGLLDGDGSIVKNTTLTNPRFSAKFSTSSVFLRDSVLSLMYRLGIRGGCTSSPPRGWSKEAYTVYLSTTDMYPILSKLTCLGVREIELIKEWMNNKPADVKNGMVVPITHKEHKVISKAARVHGFDSLYSSLMRDKEYPFLTDYSIKQLITIKSIAEMDEIKAVVERLNSDVNWERIENAVDAGERTVYDFYVPETKVFIVNNGLVVWDTMNFHVPVSDKAVAEAYSKMLPSKNLTSLTDLKSVRHPPSKEFSLGIYLLTRDPAKKPPRVFRSKEEAKTAYRKGEIKANDPIEIAG